MEIKMDGEMKIRTTKMILGATQMAMQRRNQSL
jgi:hypothetical protein